MFKKALFALLILALPSCNKPADTHLVIADNAKVDSSANLKDSIVQDLLFNPLLYYEGGLTIHNTIIEKANLLNNGKAVEVDIIKGIRFHDGKNLTAKDIATSFNRVLERDVYIKERYGTLKATVIGEFTVIFSDEKPIPNLNGLLSNVYIYSDGIVGTGPYKIHRWIDNGVELSANDDYFEGPPKLKKVVYRYEPDERKRVNMLLKGEADLLAWLSPEMVGFLKEDNKFYVKEWPTGFYSAIFLNNESSLFSDKTLRKAVSLAIDRDKLIKEVLKGGGVRTSTPLPPQVFHTENNTGYSPREAVRLLKDAGWRDSDGDGILEKNGRKLRFRLYYNINMEEFKKTADLISQYLFEIGMGVEAVPADINESADKNFKAGSYDAVIEGKSSLDAVNLTTWSSSSPKNLSHFSNIEMDSLLNRLRDAKDIGQKKEIYSKMQRIFEEETPAVFLYNPVIFTAVSKRFKGAEDFVGNVYSIYKIKDWSVNE